MPEDKDDKDPKPGQDATHSGDPGSSPDAPAPGDAGGPLPPRPEDLPNPAPNPDGGPPIVNPNPATNPGRVGTVSTETAPPLKTEEDSAGSKPPAAEGADAPPANKPGARSPGTKGK